MTSVFHRPTTTGGAEPGDSAEQRAREATNRCIANLTNVSVSRHRQTMASQEALARDIRRYAERHDQGNGALLQMADAISDQIADGHEAMATKADLARVEQKIDLLLAHRQQVDYVEIPREERCFTFDPDEAL